MDRLVPVLAIALIMGGLTAGMVWWLYGNRQAWLARDHKRLSQRRLALRKAVGWAVVVLLLVAASVGVAYFSYSE
jgi:hypothetical protein